MTKDSQLKSQTIMVLLLVFILSGYCYLHWQNLKENRLDIRGVAEQVDVSLADTHLLDQRLKQRLRLLTSTRHLPLAEKYSPEYWLSELRQEVSRNDSLKSFSARFLVDKTELLGKHENNELFVTPIDLELTVLEASQAVNAITLLGESLGSHVSVQYCRLQERINHADHTDFRLQCRLGKVAIREARL